MMAHPDEPQRPIGDNIPASQQASQQASQPASAGLPAGNSYWMQLDEGVRTTWAHEHHLTAQDYVALTADMAIALGATPQWEPFVVMAESDLPDIPDTPAASALGHLARRLAVPLENDLSDATASTTATDAKSQPTLQPEIVREVIERMVSQEGALTAFERVDLTQRRRRVRERIETGVTLLVALTVGFALSVIWGYALRALPGLVGLYALLLLIGVAYVLQRAQESRRLSEQMVALGNVQTANTSASAPGATPDAAPPTTPKITAAQREEIAQLLQNIHTHWPSNNPDTPADEQ